MTQKLFIGLISLFGFLGSANAGLLDQGEDNPFLPVDEAFLLEAVGIEDNQLMVRWLIADDYYLYRHRFGFRSLDTDAVTLGTAIIPDGKSKLDEYFGEVEVYHKLLDIKLPLQSGALPDLLTIEVDYQGCAERGLCYPPQTRKLEFDLSGVVPTARSLIENPDSISESDRLATLISEGSWLAFSLQFFALGLLLAFTPCILPMVPILSSIIVGLDQEGNALKGFLLSVSYVVAMATAYAFLGAAAGVFGHNIQAAMQAPLFIGVFSAIFVLLALAMFGVYRLQLPSGWQSRVNEWSSKHKGGTFLGAGAMGFLAALIVGPCLAPPLAGALLYIGQTGDPFRGASALFSMGLGMGVPLIILGTLEGRLLPKAGPWMERINHVFGVILLGVAIWLLSRVIPAQWSMTLWAMLVIGSGLHLGALNRTAEGGWGHALQALGIVTMLYGVVIMLGGMMGNEDPLKPVSGAQWSQPSSNKVQHVEFRRIKTAEDLQVELARAKGDNQPVMLDFYADWCVSCKIMEDKVFPDSEVLPRLDQIRLLQADVTANDDQDRALMQSLEVIGPPTMLFYDAQGNEQRGLRLVGELNAPDFASHLDRLLNP